MIANEGDTDGCEEMDEWLRDDETIVEDWEVAKLKPRTSYLSQSGTEIDRILACRSEKMKVQMRGRYGALLKGQFMLKERRKYLVKWKTCHIRSQFGRMKMLSKMKVKLLNFIDLIIHHD